MFFTTVAAFAMLCWAQQGNSDQLYTDTEELKHNFNAMIDESMHQSVARDYFESLDIEQRFDDGKNKLDKLVTEFEKIHEGSLVAVERLRSSVETGYETSLYSSIVNLMPSWLGTRPFCCSSSATYKETGILFSNTACELTAASTPYFASTVSDSFEKASILNLKKYPSIKRQYFGSVEGRTAVYPALQISDCGNFDSRNRPWYVQASNKQKRQIVLIIDNTESLFNSILEFYWDLMGSLKKLARVHISQLKPSDEIVVLLVAGKEEGKRIFHEKMLLATGQNKKEIIDYIEKIQPQSKSEFPDTFKKAFSYYQENFYTMKDDRSREIVFLSAGHNNNHIPSAELKEMIQEYTRRRVNQVKFTVGKTTGEASHCNVLEASYLDYWPQPKFVIYSTALATGMTTLFEIFEQLKIVVKHMYTNLHLEMLLGINSFAFKGLLFGENPEPIVPKNIDAKSPIWTFPYMDAGGLGQVISVSVPVYQNEELIGVSGVDISFDTMFDNSELQSDDYSYAFLIDQEGHALKHPFLENNEETDLNFIDISSLERDPHFHRIVNLIKREESGTSQIYTERPVSTGNHQSYVSKPMRFLATYLWKRVPNTKYTITVVVSSDPVIKMLPEAHLPAGSIQFHRLDVSPPKHSCVHYNNYATMDKSSLYLAPRAFIHKQDQQEERIQTADDLQDLLSYLNKFGKNKLLLKNGVKEDIIASNHLQELWLSKHNSYESNVIWRHFTTPSGVFRIYPGIKMSDGYDPTLREWYQQSVAFKDLGAIITTPYRDPASHEIVVTMAESIYKSSSFFTSRNTYTKLFGVTAHDISVEYFQRMIFDWFPSCKEFNYWCYLMDHSGFLIVSNIDNFTNPHLKSIRDRKEDAVKHHLIDFAQEISAHLIKHNILKVENCSLIASGCSQKVYQMKKFTTVFKRSFENGNKRISFQLIPIERTNTYLLVRSSERKKNSIEKSIDYHKPRIKEKPKCIGSYLGSFLTASPCSTTTYDQVRLFEKTTYSSLPKCYDTAYKTIKAKRNESYNVYYFYIKVPISLIAIYYILKCSVKIIKMRKLGGTKENREKFKNDAAVRESPFQKSKSLCKVQVQKIDGKREKVLENNNKMQPSSSKSKQQFQSNYKKSYSVDIKENSIEKIKGKLNEKKWNGDNVKTTCEKVDYADRSPFVGECTQKLEINQSKQLNDVKISKAKADFIGHKQAENNQTKINVEKVQPQLNEEIKSNHKIAAVDENVSKHCEKRSAQKSTVTKKGMQTKAIGLLKQEKGMSSLESEGSSECDNDHRRSLRRGSRIEKKNSIKKTSKNIENNQSSVNEKTSSEIFQSKVSKTSSIDKSVGKRETANVDDNVSKLCAGLNAQKSTGTKKGMLTKAIGLLKQEKGMCSWESEGSSEYDNDQHRSSRGESKIEKKKSIQKMSKNENIQFSANVEQTNTKIFHSKISTSASIDKSVEKYVITSVDNVSTFCEGSSAEKSPKKGNLTKIVLKDIKAASSLESEISSDSDIGRGRQLKRGSRLDAKKIIKKSNKIIENNQSLEIKRNDSKTFNKIKGNNQTNKDLQTNKLKRICTNDMKKELIKDILEEIISSSVKKANIKQKHSDKEYERTNLDIQKAIKPNIDFDMMKDNFVKPNQSNSNNISECDGIEAPKSYVKMCVKEINENIANNDASTKPKRSGLRRPMVKVFPKFHKRLQSVDQQNCKISSSKFQLVDEKKDDDALKQLKVVPHQDADSIDEQNIKILSKSTLENDGTKNKHNGGVVENTLDTAEFEHAERKEVNKLIIEREQEYDQNKESSKDPLLEKVSQVRKTIVEKKIYRKVNSNLEQITESKIGNNKKSTGKDQNQKPDEQEIGLLKTESLSHNKTTQLLASDAISENEEAILLNHRLFSQEGASLEEELQNFEIEMRAFFKSYVLTETTEPNISENLMPIEEDRNNQTKKHGNDQCSAGKKQTPNPKNTQLYKRTEKIQQSKNTTLQHPVKMQESTIKSNNTIENKDGTKNASKLQSLLAKPKIFIHKEDQAIEHIKTTTSGKGEKKINKKKIAEKYQKMKGKNKNEIQVDESKIENKSNDLKKHKKIKADSKQKHNINKQFPNASFSSEPDKSMTKKTNDLLDLALESFSPKEKTMTSLLTDEENDEFQRYMKELLQDSDFSDSPSSHCKGNLEKERTSNIGVVENSSEKDAINRLCWIQEDANNADLSNTSLKKDNSQILFTSTNSSVKISKDIFHQTMESFAPIDMKMISQPTNAEIEKYQIYLKELRDNEKYAVSTSRQCKNEAVESDENAKYEMEKKPKDILDQVMESLSPREKAMTSLLTPEENIEFQQYLKELSKDDFMEDNFSLKTSQNCNFLFQFNNIDDYSWMIESTDKTECNDFLRTSFSSAFIDDLHHQENDSAARRTQSLPAALLSKQNNNH